jgi:hypothetical protein
MQKTLDKIDQLIDLHSTMGSDFTAKKLKEIRDEVVGMYSEEEVLHILHNYRNHFELHRNLQVLPNMFFEWFEKFKKKSNENK